MAQNKPSGFRFRLPWLLQPALAPPPASAPEPPRTTVQTSAASTSAQKPPFRPPGRAPPAPTRTPPQAPAPPPPPPPPPPPVEAKSSVPRSLIAKTLDQSTKETQPTTTTTSGTASTIETEGPATLPQRPPLRTVSPPRADSKPLSPSRLATQPRLPSSPPPPPPPPTITKSAVQEVSDNNGAKPHLLTSKPEHTQEIKKSTEMTHEKFPVDSYHVPQGADSAIDAKPKEMTKMNGAQTKSMNLHSMEAKPKEMTKVSLHREIKDDIFKFIHKMATSPPKQSMDEKPASVITLAGDNKGATMQLGPDANKRGEAVDIRRGYKLGDAINGEGTSKGKKSETDENQETKAIVNNNVQGINNSIMFNSSVTENNPGVHLAFSRKLENTDSKMKDTEPVEMFKAEADITPPETVIYDPAIGRSLGGFFLEPSDSEPDDSEMFGKEYEIEVL